MDLLSTLLNIRQLQNQQSLFVEQPWVPESKVMLFETPFDQKILLNNFTFFLDVAELKFLILHFEAKNVCLRDSCYLIIEHVLEKNSFNEQH
jgi:hypothetical protein